MEVFSGSVGLLPCLEMARPQNGVAREAQDGVARLQSFPPSSCRSRDLPGRGPTLFFAGISRRVLLILFSDV
jgi:hypothetical protein